MDADDLRAQELEALATIFPEESIDKEQHRGEIKVPLVFLEPVIIRLGEITKSVRHLPPVALTFQLPPQYPEVPPIIDISSPAHTKEALKSLLDKILALWEGYEVIFTMVDAVRESAESMLQTPFRCDPATFDEFIEYNRLQCTAEFNASTFECEICQSDHKGSGCSRFECAHVFCNQCLQDFFSALITAGSIERVHCPNAECTAKFSKLKEKYIKASDKFDVREFRHQLLTPPVSVNMLRHILQDESLITRYLDLFTKQQNELVARLFPSRLVSCPDCPEMVLREDINDPLVICRGCNFAFCFECRKSWHGFYKSCQKKAGTGLYADIPIEDLEKWLHLDKDSTERRALDFKHGKLLIKKAANEYLMDKLFQELLNDESQGLRKCPSCEIVIQRSDGCNKMRCSNCTTFFCNICGMYLNQDDPYEHFNSYQSTCYGRLFEGMEGV